MAERHPRPAKVKNKNAAGVQITAEQILKEAESSREKPTPRPKQRIADKDELADYRLSKRQHFEDIVRRNRTAIPAWLKYAAWEESQSELERARSVFERALDFDARNQTLWLKYTELEMRHRNVNRARNVFDRVVAILPRIDLFWYKYTYMEELLDNAPGARQVYERWMEWEPPEEAWMAFVKFEMRYNERLRAREVFRRFVGLFPHPKNWIKWARFEEQNGEMDMSREIYTQCMTTLGDAFIDQNVYISFARFETRQHEIERARVIYKYALEKLPEGRKENLYNAYTQFEKQYGGKDGVEDVVISKRRIKYEDEIAAAPHNYDIWFDYIRLEESTGRPEKIREVYERAIANIPPVDEKRYWRRYIYLWLFYAIWEESVAKDPARAREVYAKCMRVIPHKTFTFAKFWLLYARFLIRQRELTAARKVLGQAIGMAPKEHLFKGYIEIELSLREFDRVRTLYQRYLEWNPANCAAWIKFAELESMLGDTDRARGIFDIAVSQPALDMPEVLWKAYIDFEVRETEWRRARVLYERLLQLTDHVKVHISFCHFEMDAMDIGFDGDVDGDDGRGVAVRVQRARGRFNQSNARLKRTGAAKEERVILLEAWLAFERKHGDAQSAKAVQSRLPRPVKKRRRIEDDRGNIAGWEEYYDYIFPDDEEDKPNFKLLALAHQWKTKMAQMGAGNAANDDDDEDEDDDGDNQKDDKDDNNNDDDEDDKGDATVDQPSDNDDDDNDDADETQMETE